MKYLRAWYQERIDLNFLDIENVFANDGGKCHVLNEMDLSCNIETVV